MYVQHCYKSAYQEIEGRAMCMLRPDNLEASCFIIDLILCFSHFFFVLIQWLFKKNVNVMLWIICFRDWSSKKDWVWMKMRMRMHVLYRELRLYLFDIKEFREVPQVCTCINIHSDYIMWTFNITMHAFLSSLWNKKKQMV